MVIYHVFCLHPVQSNISWTFPDCQVKRRRWEEYISPLMLPFESTLSPMVIGYEIQSVLEPHQLNITWTWVLLPSPSMKVLMSWLIISVVVRVYDTSFLWPEELFHFLQCNQWQLGWSMIHVKFPFRISLQKLPYAKKISLVNKDKS